MPRPQSMPSEFCTVAALWLNRCGKHEPGWSSLLPLAYRECEVRHLRGPTPQGELKPLQTQAATSSYAFQLGGVTRVMRWGFESLSDCASPIGETPKTNNKSLVVC